MLACKLPQLHLKQRDNKSCLWLILQGEPLDAAGGEQPLALYSQPLGVTCAAKISRQQLVCFTWKAGSFDSVWQVRHVLLAGVRHIQGSSTGSRSCLVSTQFSQMLYMLQLSQRVTGETSPCSTFSRMQTVAQPRVSMIPASLWLKGFLQHE
jgi:hypothetical protein